MILVFYKLIGNKEWDKFHTQKCDRVICDRKEEKLIFKKNNKILKVLSLYNISSLYIYYPVIDEVEKWI